jgi:hypothetical protein
MTEQTETKPVERWTYTGRRRGAKNLTYYAWIDKSGEDRWYRKLRASVIGGIYTVEVDRSSENVSVYPASLQYTGDRVEPEKRADWELRDRTLMVTIERERLEKKHAGESEFDKAMAPLRQLYAQQRTWSQRAALTAMVLSELGR